MFQIKPSIINQYIYSNTGGGGFPMEEYINNINNENGKLGIIGGGATNSIGANKFKDITIPIGLLSFPHICNSSAINDVKHAKTIDLIDTDQFDKLFNSVAEIKKNAKMGGARYTRKTSKIVR